MPYPNSGGYQPTAPASATGAMDAEALKQERYRLYMDEMLNGGDQAAQDGTPSETNNQQPMPQNGGQPQPQGMAQGQMRGQMQGQARSMNAVPFEAVMQRLLQTPGMVQHLQGGDADGDVPDFPSLGPPPSDPQDYRDWQVMNLMQQQMKQVFLQKNRRNRFESRQMNDQRMLQNLEAHDPLFKVVSPMMKNYFDHLPGPLGQVIMHTVVSHPALYIEMYSHVRSYVEKAISTRKNFQGNPMSPATAAADPRQRIRQAVAGRMSPPALENAGVMDDRLPNASRNAQLAALKQRVKSGGACEGDLLKYLELSGFGD